METFDGKGRLVIQHDEYELYETSPGRFTLRVDDDPVSWGMSYPVARDLWHLKTHQTMAENIRVDSWREAKPRTAKK